MTLYLHPFARWQLCWCFRCAARWPPQYDPAPWPWLLTLKLVRYIALVVGNLPTNFGVSTSFRSRVIDRHASDRSRDLVTLGFDLGGHGTCEWRGSSWSICVLSLKFVGLTVPEISLIMCLSINGPGDLETVVSVTCVLGYLPTNFGLPSTFGSRVIHYVRDRQTDRRTYGKWNIS